VYRSVFKWTFCQLLKEKPNRTKLFKFLPRKQLRKVENSEEILQREFLKPTGGFYQPAYMVNYPSLEVNYTRIAEYKHTPNQPESVKDNPWTVIVKEYSTDKGDPYYPVPNEKNHKLYKKYQVPVLSNVSFFIAAAFACQA
jgi:hypothetical protein